MYLGIPKCAMRIHDPYPKWSDSSRIEQIVAALDRRPIVRGRNFWTAFVLGVHTDGHDWWIQLGSDEPSQAALLLRCPPGTTLDSVLAALDEWDPARAPSQSVI